MQGILSHAKPAARISLAGKCMWLVSHERDNSVERLVAEVPRDGYRLRALPRTGRMIDVGSNLGDQSIAACLWRPSMQILAIEPVPLTYFFMQLNLHLNRVPLISLQEFAKGSTPGVLPLHGAIVATEANASSVVPVRWSTAQSQDAAVDLASRGGTAPGGAAARWVTSQVRAIHLPSLLAAAHVPNIVLLKADCEGCEYALVTILTLRSPNAPLPYSPLARARILSSSPLHVWTQFATPHAAFNLADRRLVARIAMELHVFLGSRNRTRPTLASKSPLPMARAAERVLGARGCRAPANARGPGVRVGCRR
jgi:FkbM family methyltransferase